MHLKSHLFSYYSEVTFKILAYIHIFSFCVCVEVVLGGGVGDVCTSWYIYARKNIHMYIHIYLYLLNIYFVCQILW